MSITVILLEKKLRQYVNQLCKVTEEATVKLTQEAIHDLKESSMILNKMISRIREIQAEIQQLPEHFLDKTDKLLNVVDSSLTAEVAAETILCKIDTKLLDLIEDNNKLSTPKRTPKSVDIVYPSSNTEIIKNEVSLPREVSKSDAEIIQNNDSSNFEETRNESSLPEEIVDDEAKKLSNTIPDTQSNSSKEESEKSSSVDENISLTCSVTSPIAPQTGFELKKCIGTSDYDYTRFLKDFLITIHDSPLEDNYKFAALRGLIRGYPYRFFLDLDYRKESHYQRALERFFDEFADEELRLTKASERNVRLWVPLSASDSNLAYNFSASWNDEYFNQNYCKKVPNYEKPSRELLTQAIHAFLNLYVFGPGKVTRKGWHHVWLILLHGVKFNDRYMLDRRSNSAIFGNNNKVPFPEIASSTQMSVERYAPCLIQKRSTQAKNPKLWEWKYSTVEDGDPVEEVITSSKVKSWYLACWNTVETADENTFNDYVRYFALLSMVVFRVTVKKPDNIEKHVALVFNKAFRSFCRAVLMPNAVPPHVCIHNLIRRNVFRRNGRNFKKYLTYLVGSYAFCDTDMRKQTRLFLNIGCLMQFSSAGIGSIYWLRRAAEEKGIRPLDFLKFFLIDPSMETSVKKLYQFIETYRKDITYWWCRFFEKEKLQEMSTAKNAAFTYACFVVTAGSEGEISESKNYDQFRCIKDLPPNLNGENLGRIVKLIVDEWNSTPLSQITRPLHKNAEIGKCFKKSARKEKKNNQETD